MTSDDLRARLGAYLGGPALGPLTALTGGFDCSLYTFTLGSAERVLKLYPPSAHGRDQALREWRALTQLQAMNYSVPQVFSVGPDSRHLGRPFIVMERIPAASLWSVFENADPATQARLTRSYVAQLVALQALEPVAGLTHPSGCLDQELGHLRRDAPNSLATIVHWLENHRPKLPDEPPVIQHRDYHPWNVLVDPAQRLWVIDWDWRIGDARFDLAWTCMLMQRSGFDAFSSGVRDEYARQSARSLEGLDYFEVLTTVRWLLNVLPATDPGFRAFLVDPLRRAQVLLRERTGIEVRLTRAR